MTRNNLIKHILISQELYDKIQKDKKHFQMLIGGGIWTNNDVLEEWYKILQGVAKQ
ncbi:MAG: hypothetical protein ABIJ18_05710 [archaeon]